jgi:hypothetical protein
VLHYLSQLCCQPAGTVKEVGVRTADELLGVLSQCHAVAGGEDEFVSTIGGIGPAFDEAAVFEFVDDADDLTRIQRQDLGDPPLMVRIPCRFGSSVDVPQNYNRSAAFRSCPVDFAPNSLPPQTGSRSRRPMLPPGSPGAAWDPPHGSCPCLPVEIERVLDRRCQQFLLIRKKEPHLTSQCRNRDSDNVVNADGGIFFEPLRTPTGTSVDTPRTVTVIVPR